MPSHRLLVVEDSAVQAELLRGDLHAAGHEVEVVSDGAAALDRLAQERPDAIISDVVMPGMDGYELCRRIKNDPELAAIPVVLLTSLRDPVDVVRGLECGADNFLTKPYAPDQLLQRLDTVTRSRDRIADNAGVDAVLLGHRFTIDTDRQQTLDMLMSSFEDLIHANERLRAREEELRAARDALAVEAEVSQRRSRELERNRQELRRTLEDTGVATWCLRLPGGRFEWSDNVHQVHGLRPDTPVDDLASCLRLMHDEDHHLLRALAAEAPEPGFVLPDEWRYRVNGADGRTRTFTGRGHVVRADDGGVTVSGVAFDVTELRELEQQLQARQRWLDGVVAASPDAILVLGRDLRIQFASERVWDLAGTDPATLIGRTFRELLAAGNWRTVSSSPDQLRFAGGSIDRLRLEVDHADGRVLTIEARVGELRTEEGRVEGYVAAARDVTQQARLEAELERARNEANAANRAKSEYLSRMSHELRTPMNSVLGFAQLLQMSELEPPDAQGVEMILRSGRHLLSLIDDVLDIARIESGSLSLSLEPVNLAEVATDAVELLEPQLTERGIAVTTDEHAGSEACVWADRQRLSQVLINLLSNAVKYNRPDGAIHLTWSALGDRRRLCVTDTGYGIADEDVPRLFSTFDRLGADRTDVAGTGLGLALSKSLVEAMGGRIGCESTVGEGSTFWVELPVAVGAADPPAADEGEDGGQDPTWPPDTADVLYIEDNLLNFELVRRALVRERDVELRSARTAEEGIREAVTDPPDLILLDLHLAGGSGREVLETLRAAAPTAQVPILIVSADATTSSTAELLDAGADGYLTKPFGLHELQETVGHFLRVGRRSTPVAPHPVPTAREELEWPRS